VRDLNGFGVPGWLLKASLLERDYFSRLQLKIQKRKAFVWTEAIYGTEQRYEIWILRP